MNSKFYVSLEAARLLKEKGYNEVCDTAYDNEGIIGRPPTKCNNTKLAALSFVFGDDCYSAPTKSEAIDWLESKGIVISVEYINGLWDCQIYSFVDGTILHGKALPMVYDMVNFTTRLEAEDAAIIKALELL